jgi:hypothetical protein
MNRRELKQPSGQVHANVAVRELIDRDSDYDTSTTAWAEFDRRITAQLADLETRLHRYITPAAGRKELGR